jgi:hypothetical protein
MPQSKTIDNLGVDISIRYAQNDDLYDENIIKDSKSIPKFTQLSINIPYFPSEVDELFGYEHKASSWAEFSPPTSFLTSNIQLFSYQIIPSLGPIEKQEEEKEKIKRKKKKMKSKKSLAQIEKEEEHDEEDREILINLFECLFILNKNLEDINAKRGQYHKG